MARFKSVNSKLDEIIENQNREPLTISQQIGEKFDPYFKRSTVYYYENDTRLFNSWKKQAMKISLISLTVAFLFLLASILFGAFSRFNPPLVIASSFSFLLTLFCFIYNLKLKEKVLGKNKYNIQNIEFYFFEDTLRWEKSKGKIVTFLSIAKIITAAIYIGAFVFALIDYLNGKALSSEYIISFFSSLAIVMIAPTVLLGCSPKWYYDYSIVFDTEKSYVIFDWHSFKKINK